MHPHKTFAFDVGITFLASVVTLLLGFVITIVLGRYLGAGDLGLYRMASAIYGIAMLHMRNIPPEVLKTFERIKKRRLAGVICLVSDMDKDGIDMFDMYKGREDVELAFDTTKNRLESDKTYLRSDEAVRGYFLATFLASLREKGLTNKISAEEVLFELSKVTKIVEKSGREYFAKIPKRARRMCSLFPEVLPMG